MRETAEDRRESEAVANARQRVALIAETYGTNHLEYATGLNQLALLLIMQGDTGSAEPLLRQALGIRREALGERHPDYATNLSSLGGLVWARGDLEQAEPLLRQAAEVRSETLGMRHPKTLISLSSLEQLLKARRDLFGPEAAGPGPEREPEPAPANPVADEPAPPAPVGVAPEQVPAAGPAEAPTAPRPEPGAAPPAVVVAGGEGVPAPLEQIAADLESLTREFAGLGDRLTATAERLARGVIEPADDVSAACASAREGFARLREGAAVAARSLSVQVPAGGPASLKDVSDLLPSLRSADAARSTAEAGRRAAAGVLGRVERLACPGDPAFTPLAACREQARALRRSIEGATPGELPEATRGLVEGDHPLAVLLKLVEADPSTDDAQWADWYDATGAAFGDALAVAVARSRVVTGGP